jgi:hypothetical protein
MNTHTRFYGGESIEAEYWRISKINKNGVIVKKTQLSAYTHTKLSEIDDTRLLCETTKHIVTHMSENGVIIDQITEPTKLSVLQ